MGLVNSPSPVLALDYPWLADTCRACADDNIEIMSASGSDDVLTNIGVHADKAEVVGGLFLVVPPRCHAFQCATGG